MHSLQLHAQNMMRGILQKLMSHSRDVAGSSSSLASCTCASREAQPWAKESGNYAPSPRPALTASVFITAQPCKEAADMCNFIIERAWT
eukprot:3685582-Amphidinium_carterae.1